MKFLTLFAITILLLGSGCASTKWEAESIPYPKSTPFDANEFARRTYLDGFRSGYRAQLGQEATTIDVIRGPYLQARRLGFQAGAAHARAGVEAGADGKK
jgi:hypothetical protein